MAQPVPTIQMSDVLLEQARLFFNRNQYYQTYRMIANTTIAVPTAELAIDGKYANLTTLAGPKRLVFPTESSSLVLMFYTAYNVTDTKSASVFSYYNVRNNAAGDTAVAAATATAGVVNAVVGEATPNIALPTVAAGPAASSYITITVGTAAKIQHHEALILVATATFPESNFGAVVDTAVAIP